VALTLNLSLGLLHELIQPSYDKSGHETNLKIPFVNDGTALLVTLGPDCLTQHLTSD
jgi:hypothetical protein